MFLPIQPVRFLGIQTTRHPAKEGVPCSAGLAHVRVRIQRRAVAAQSCRRCGVAGMADSGMIRLGRRAVRGAWLPAGQHRDGVFGAKADTHVAWDQCALYIARGLPGLAALVGERHCAPGGRGRARRPGLSGSHSSKPTRPPRDGGARRSACEQARPPEPAQPPAVSDGVGDGQYGRRSGAGHPAVPYGAHGPRRVPGG